MEYPYHNHNKSFDYRPVESQETDATQFTFGNHYDSNGYCVHS